MRRLLRFARSQRPFPPYRLWLRLRLDPRVQLLDWRLATVEPMSDEELDLAFAAIRLRERIEEADHRNREGQWP